MRLVKTLALMVLCAALSACSTSDGTPSGDTITDSGADSGADSGVDSGADSGVDASTGDDAEPAAPDTPGDKSPDTPPDGPPDPLDTPSPPDVPDPPADIPTDLGPDVPAPPTGDPPVWPAASSLAALPISSQSVTLVWTSASDGAGGIASYALTADGAPLATVGGGTTTHTATGLSPGIAVTFTVQAIDHADQATSSPLEATAAPLTLAQTPTAPEPPPLDPTVAPDFGDLIEFVTAGPDAPQTDLEPDALDPDRLGALRGAVTDRDGNPMAAVRVAVDGRPELGETLTTADGRFIMVVPAAVPLVVDFSRDGFLPAQRRARVIRDDFTWVETVALVPLSATVTEILVGAADAQVARGDLVEDADGPRRATVIFPAGFGASVEHNDGSSTPLTYWTRCPMGSRTTGATCLRATPPRAPGTARWTGRGTGWGG